MFYNRSTYINIDNLSSLHEKDHNYFELLKQKIVIVMQQSFPGIAVSMNDWKGQEITDFQEDLRFRVNAHISEKWFYTHMKASHHSLPRIDMLNLLSKYAGYANWDDFVFQNRVEVPVNGTFKQINDNRYFYIIPLLAIVIMLILFGLFKLFNVREYRFTFVDADTRDTIANLNTELILLDEKESPVHYLLEKDGSVHLKTDHSRIRFVVNSPYYQIDTIDRIVRKLNTDETVMLKPDDYSMMIHYFSTMKVDDWEKRREKLDKMIDDNAMICQVMSKNTEEGMALFNKSEFIDRLTIPSGSLRNIEILNTQLKEGRIMLLKFRIKGGRP